MGYPLVGSHLHSIALFSSPTFICEVASTGPEGHSTTTTAVVILSIQIYFQRKFSRFTTCCQENNLSINLCFAVKVCEVNQMRNLLSCFTVFCR